MEQVTSIREHLPYGAIKRISDKTGKSLSTINRVIDGNSIDSIVLSELNREIQAEKRRKEKAQKIRAAMIMN